MSNNPKTVQPYSGERLLSIHKVQEITGRSRTAIYNDKSFPKSVKISERRIGWPESEVRAWVDAKIAQREAA